MFRRRTGNFRRRAAFGRGRNSGSTSSFLLPFLSLFMLDHRLLVRRSSMTLRLASAEMRIRKKRKLPLLLLYHWR